MPIMPDTAMCSPLRKGRPWSFLPRVACLEFPDDFFRGKLGIRLGREIVRSDEAGCHSASDETAGLPIRSYGRAPISRSALVGNNRKLRYLGHVASVGRPRASYAAMSTFLTPQNYPKV